MGDRTYCTTTINIYYYKQFKTELDALAKAQYYEVEKEDELVNFNDDQANYGDMPEIVSFLSEREIEYDKRWESGGDYSAGSEYAREVKGIYTKCDIYEGGEDLINNLKELLACNTNERENLIKIKLKHLEPFEVTPLSMPQSIDFIKNA